VGLILGYLVLRFPIKYLCALFLFSLWLWIVILGKKLSVGLGTLVISDVFFLNYLWWEKHIGNFKISISEVLMVFILIFVIIENSNKNFDRSKFGFLSLLWVGYILLFLLASFYSTSFWEGFYYFMYFAVESYLVFYLTVRILRGPKHANLFFLTIILFGGFVALISAIHFFTGRILINAQAQAHYIAQAGEQVRTGGFLLNPNILGAFLIILFPITFAFFLNKKNVFNKGLYGAILLLLSFGIIVTLSRSAWLGAGVCCIIFFMFLKAAMRKLALLTLTFLVFLSVCGFGAKYGSLITERFYSILSGDYRSAKFGEETSVESRLIIWRTTLNIIKRNPILGIGPGEYTFMARSPRYGPLPAQGYAHPHNSYLWLAASTGVPSILLFSLMIVFIARDGFHFLKQIDDVFLHTIMVALISGCLGFLIASFFDFQLFRRELNHLFWIIAGAIFAISRFRSQGKSLRQGESSI